jgi:hypothetical protein
MPADATRAAQSRWCDAEGTHISLFCRVEQVAEDPDQGALFSRMHKRGEVIGRGPDLLYVRFEGEDGVISLSPQLVRLLTTEPGERYEWDTWRQATVQRSRVR